VPGITRAARSPKTPITTEAAAQITPLRVFFGLGMEEKDQGQNNAHADLKNPEDPPVVPGHQIHRRLAGREIEMGQFIDKNHGQENNNDAGEKPAE